MSFNQDNELFRVTKEIVLAHVSHNEVRAESLPDVIRQVHQALSDIRSVGSVASQGSSQDVAAFAQPVAPAAQTESVQPAPETAPMPVEAETPAPAPAVAEEPVPVAAVPENVETPTSLMAQPEDQPTPETPEAASDDEAAHKARRTKSVKKQSPAVPIEESVQPDYIVCLEDGKHFKMMKRYLRSTYQMTPDQYRAKWGLPDDYPMVAPNYRAEKSNYAKMVGLGTERIQRNRKRAAA